MTSLVYRDPRLYRGILRLLYGSDLARRERVVRRMIRKGSVVIDVACGDAGIARRLKDVRYVGVDVSPVFIDALKRRGLEGRVIDLTRDEPPTGDVVCLLGALYQFLPDAGPVVERLRRAARSHVVLAEPYRNLAQSKNPLVAAIARRATNPGVDSSTHRFDEASLRALLVRHGATEIVDTGREFVARLPGLAS